ncbi:MAG: ASCH domain-containing protein [Archaeoglobaceae archaeon]
MGDAENAGMEINFDRQYVEPILKGEKKTTIRKGIKLNLLKKGKDTGNIADLVANGEVFAQAKITKVIVKRADELTDDDALLDGFHNLEELMTTLTNIYGELNENELITIIHFDVVD